MSESNSLVSSDGIETLIDIAVTLADYTQGLEGVREIPAFLSGVLNVPEVALSVVCQPSDAAEPQFLIFSSFMRGSEPQEGAACSEQAMGIYRRVKVLMEEDEQGLRMMQMRYPDGPILETREEREGRIIQRSIYAYALDGVHLMQLTFGRFVTGPESISAPESNLLAISRELAKQLHCLVIWQSSPWILGSPFDRLTKRELVVLRGLDSDASEKQLAAQLCHRPNTLHSHIKSIYHKVGVQGRLPLLQVFHAALRKMRVEMHNNQAQQSSAQQGGAQHLEAVGAGERS